MKWTPPRCVPPAFPALIVVPVVTVLLAQFTTWTDSLVQIAKNFLLFPVIAVIDTNCDPDMVDYKVPGNDDAIRAIRLFCSSIAEAINEGKTIHEQSLVKAKEDDRAAAESTGAEGAVAAGA